MSSTVTKYSDPNDGVVRAGYSTWSDSRDGGGSVVTTSGNSFVVRVDVDDNPGSPGNDHYLIGRGFIEFDTSSLSSNVGLISAVLSLYIEEISDELTGTNEVHIVAGSHSNPLVLADYLAHRDIITKIATIDVPNVTTNQYTDITLPVSSINRGGTTKFCLRENHDLANIVAVRSDPGETLSTNGIIVTSGNASSNKPKLVVVYYKAGYPLSDVGRVGSLIHRRDVEAGVYTLEISFGGLSATPPSTASARLSGTLGTETPEEDVIPTCPPDWNLRYSAERGWYCEPPSPTLAASRGELPTLTKDVRKQLTPYAQSKSQCLYANGYIDANGAPTPKGIAWAQAHPMEEPPECRGV